MCYTDYEVCFQKDLRPLVRGYTGSEGENGWWIFEGEISKHYVFDLNYAFFLSAETLKHSSVDLNVSSRTFGSGCDLDTTGGGGIDLDITEDPTEDTEVVVFKSLPDRLTNCVRWGFLGFF